MADRLYRSRDDRMVAGVAGGLAEMWGADPALIRIIWALLVIFTGGVALIVYIVMAIVVPEEDDAIAATGSGLAPGAADTGQQPANTGQQPAPGAPLAAGSGWVSPAPSSQQTRAEARAARRAARADRFGTSGGAIFGGFLILLGLFLLAQEYLPDIDFDWFWPLVLVGVGIFLLLSSVGRGPRSGGSA